MDPREISVFSINISACDTTISVSNGESSVSDRDICGLTDRYVCLKERALYITEISVCNRKISASD